MGRGQYRHCPVCGENYDCGEIHHCEGPVEPPKVERLDELGRVRVKECHVDKPKQITFRDGLYRYE